MESCAEHVTDEEAIEGANHIDDEASAFLEGIASATDSYDLHFVGDAEVSQ